VDAQLALDQINNELLQAPVSEAQPGIWNDAAAIQELVSRTLSAAGTSWEKLGLSIFVQMRATEWLSAAHVITSPVMPLTEAVSLRSRLLEARCSSWEALRTEWVTLMQSRKKAVSLKDAEALADRARAETLEQRLVHTLQQVERAVQQPAQRRRREVRTRGGGCLLRNPPLHAMHEDDNESNECSS